MTKLNRTKRRGYQNCVMMCDPCQGPSTAFPALLDYFNARQAGPIPKKVKTYTITAGNVDRLIAMLEPRCRDAGIEMPKRSKLAHYEKAPPERIDHIAEQVFKIALVKRKMGDRPRDIGRGAAYKSFSLKKRAAEAQGHRCCYCSDELDYHDRFSPMYVTWEHLVNVRDEGQWDEDNLVISCKMCNGDRDAKGLSPMEFWEWLQVPENLASYDKRRAILLKFHRSPYRQDTLKRRHAKQPMTRVYITR